MYRSISRRRIILLIGFQAHPSIDVVWSNRAEFLVGKSVLFGIVHVVLMAHKFNQHSMIPSKLRRFVWVSSTGHRCCLFTRICCFMNAFATIAEKRRASFSSFFCSGCQGVSRVNRLQIAVPVATGLLFLQLSVQLSLCLQPEIPF